MPAIINKPAQVATCPHCSHSLGQTVVALGEMQSCPACGKLSFVTDVKGKPVPVRREFSATVGIGDLPDPDADGTICLDGWLMRGGLKLRDTKIARRFVLRNCLIEAPENSAVALDLHGAELGNDLVFDDVVIAGNLDMHHGKIARAWNMQNVVVLGDIEAPSLSVADETRWWNVCCGKLANFYDSQFHGNALLRQTQFRGEANFNDVKFMGEGNFSYSTFATDVDFGVSDFREGAEFFGTTFGGRADFTDLSVVFWADFTASKFFGDAFFTKSRFRDGVEFSGVTFHQMAEFINAEFESDCSFTQVVAKGPMEFDHAKFGGRADFRHSKLQENADFRRATFRHIAYFQGARMNGVLMFIETDFMADLRMDNIRMQMDDDETDRPSRVTQGAPVDFSKAHVGGKFVLDDAQINASLILDGLELEDNFNAQKAVIHGELSLRKATIDGCFRWNGATFHGPVRLSGSLIGAGILAREVRGNDLWDWTGARVTGPSLFQQAVFTGRNEFGNSEFRGRFDISNATFTEKLDLLSTKFDANLVIDGLRAEHLLIARKQVENHLQNEVFAKHGNDLGRYWRIVAQEYSVLKRSFAMQTQYGDMDWAHLRYSQALRRYRSFLCHFPEFRPEGAKKWEWWLRGQLNAIERVIVDWGSGYGTEPVRVLLAMLVVALVFTPVYLGSTQDAVLGNGSSETLDFIDAFSTALGAQIGIGVDNFALNFSGLQRMLALIEVFLGVGLVTLFISTLSRKIIQ